MSALVSGDRHVPVEELDDHEWSAVSSRYRVVDLDFGIRSDDPLIASFLDHVLAPFRSPGDPPRWYSFVDVGGIDPRVAVYLDEERELAVRREFVVGVFLWHLNQQVMLDTRSFLAVHAGVASLDGRAVIICGDANAGKSTLVAALVTSGFDYLSDEAALLHLDKPLVSPYRRALALEPGSWPLVPSLRPEPHPGYDHRAVWLVSAHDLAAGAAPGPRQYAAVVFPRITPGTPAELRPMSRATAVRTLARRATNLEALGAAGFRALVQVVETSTCWELALDGVDAAVSAVTAVVTKGAESSPFRTQSG